MLKKHYETLLSVLKMVVLTMILFQDSLNIQKNSIYYLCIYIYIYIYMCVCVYLIHHLVSVIIDNFNVSMLKKIIYKKNILLTPNGHAVNMQLKIIYIQVHLK